MGSYYESFRVSERSKDFGGDNELSHKAVAMFL